MLDCINAYLFCKWKVFSSQSWCLHSNIYLHDTFLDKEGRKWKRIKMKVFWVFLYLHGAKAIPDADLASLVSSQGNTSTIIVWMWLLVLAE